MYVCRQSAQKALQTQSGIVGFKFYSKLFTCNHNFNWDEKQSVLSPVQSCNAWRRTSACRSPQQSLLHCEVDGFIIMLADKIQNRTKNSNFIVRMKSHTLTCLPSQTDGFLTGFVLWLSHFMKAQILSSFWVIKDFRTFQSSNDVEFLLLLLSEDWRAGVQVGVC